jgi:hypothetical protein
VYSKEGLMALKKIFKQGAGGQLLTMIQLQLNNSELRGPLLADLKRKYGTSVREIKRERMANKCRRMGKVR